MTTIRIETGCSLPASLVLDAARDFGSRRVQV